MRCHYIHDKIAGKVLIPGCMGVAVHNDMAFCTCTPAQPDRLTALEKRVAKLEQTLNTTLKGLLKK